MNKTKRQTKTTKKKKKKEIWHKYSSINERKVEVAENMTKESTGYTQLTSIKITFTTNFF